MTTTLPPGPTRTPWGFGIDPRLGAADLRAPAASREDSRPQAILKLLCPSSLDYRAHRRLPVKWSLEWRNRLIALSKSIHQKSWCTI